MPTNSTKSVTILPKPPCDSPPSLENPEDIMSDDEVESSVNSTRKSKNISEMSENSMKSPENPSNSEESIPQHISKNDSENAPMDLSE